MGRSIPFQLRLAAAVVRRGGVIAYPTEAVFGLGCDPANRAAVQTLLALKRRPQAKGLILIAAELDQLLPWVEPLCAAHQARLAASWCQPEAITWLLPARSTAPRWLRGDHATLAVRVTAHPLAKALCWQCGSALVSTSANRAGRPPARSVLALRRQFGTELDYLLPGALGSAAQPSRIVDFASGRVVRAGQPDNEPRGYAASG